MEHVPRVAVCLGELAAEIEQSAPFGSNGSQTDDQASPASDTLVTPRRAEGSSTVKGSGSGKAQTRPTSSASSAVPTAAASGTPGRAARSSTDGTAPR